MAVPLIRGDNVVRITETTATVRHAGGGELVYVRRDAPEAVMVWEVAGSRAP